MPDDTSDVVYRARYWLDDSPDDGMYSIEESITHGLVKDLADEIERLRAELESTRQAWVNGDDPMCDDVCVIACKGPCGQGGTTDA